MAERTLDSALENLDERKQDEVLDSISASRLLVATARERLERTVVTTSAKSGHLRLR